MSSYLINFYVMVTKKWRIFIASTDRDLKYARDAIFEKLNDIGYDPIMFEKSGFIIDSDLHSHTTCVETVKTCDILVLVLDKKTGGAYLGKKNEVSITQKEYEKAIKSNIPVIVFVNQNLEQERFGIVQNIKREKGKINDSQLLEEIKKSRTNYADSPRLIHFLQVVSKKKTGNFITYFNSLSDLLVGVENRLKSLSTTISRKLLSSQVKYIKAKSTSLGVEYNLNALLKSDYLISPNYCLKENHEKTGEKDILEHIKSQNYFSFLLGKPGAGKSISISKLFCTHAEKCLKNKSNEIPIYFEFKNLKNIAEFSVKELMQESFDLYLKKENYPSLDYNILKFYFYLDGLDELPSILISEFIDKFGSHNLSNGIITARESFFNIHIRGYILEKSVGNIYKINDWSIDQGAKYIQNWLLSCKLPDLSKSFLVVANDKKYSEILSSPILSSMFAFTIKELELIPNEINDRTSLYGFFVEQLAFHEANKLNKNKQNGKNQIIDIWIQTIWLINTYKAKLKILSYSELKTYLLDKGFDKLLINKSLLAIININPISKEVKSILHETLTEYFLATYGIYAMKCGNELLDNYMETTLSGEVSSFVKEIWKKMNRDELIVCLSNLQENLKKSILQMDVTSQKRTSNMIYYLSRLPLQECVVSNLKELLCYKSDIFISNGVLFALTKLEDIDSEEILANELINNPKANNLNRGLHLEYFGDILPLSHFPPSDPANTTADKSIISLMEHLKNPTTRNLSTIRIDVITIISLAYTRDVLDDILINDIKTILNGSEIYSNNAIVNKALMLLDKIHFQKTYCDFSFPQNKKQPHSFAFSSKKYLLKRFFLDNNRQKWLRKMYQIA